MPLIVPPPTKAIHPTPARGDKNITTLFNSFVCKIISTIFLQDKLMEFSQKSLKWLNRNLDLATFRSFVTAPPVYWSANIVHKYVFNEFHVSVVVLLFSVHGKHLRSCRDGQLT